MNINLLRVDFNEISCYASYDFRRKNLFAVTQLVPRKICNAHCVCTGFWSYEFLVWSFLTDKIKTVKVYTFPSLKKSSEVSFERKFS